MKEIETETTVQTFENTSASAHVLGFHLESPKLLLNKADFPALQFVLTVEDDEGAKLFSIPGWRVMQGLIRAPSRRQGKGWAQNIITHDSAFLTLVENMVKEWQHEIAFKAVQFPK